MAGAYTSDKTLRALQLVKEGMVPARAAKAAGIHRSTLLRNKAFQEWKREQDLKKGTET